MISTQRTMQKRTLGRTGWNVSVIGFGAIKLPRIGQQECDRLLHQALDKGINFIDTADCYGDSEEKIGKALSRRRQEFFLSTKIDERDDRGVTLKLERSLRRLRTDFIDLVFFHDVRGGEYEALFERGGLSALQRAQKQGKLREIGVSIHHSISMMMEAIQSGVFSVLMVAYSALDEDRLSATILPMASREGVGLIAMKPLAGGRLGEPKAWDHRFFKKETPAQVALRYVLSRSEISCAIPGMTGLRELEENVEVGRNPRPLSAEEITRLMDWVGAVGKGFCRNCGYCLPCPEGIPIPDIFRFENYHERYALKGWAIEQYRCLPVDAAACSHCDQCVSRCPYGVPIPERLQTIHRLLGPGGG